MFYLKVFIGALWFALSCVVAILISVVRWRHPSNGYVFCRIFLSIIKPLTGIDIIIRNKERLMNSRPCIYVGNHQSNFDMITQAHTYMPRTVVIGKKELLWIPFFGLLFYTSGNILLDRKNHEKAIAGMSEAKEALTKKDISIYIFPEGTRNKGADQLLPFKKGAFYMAVDAGVPLLPIVSSPLKTALDEKNHKFYPGPFIIEVLEPIPTKGMTNEDIPKLIELTRGRMQETYDRLRAEALKSQKS